MCVNDDLSLTTCNPVQTPKDSFTGPSLTSLNTDTPHTFFRIHSGGERHCTCVLGAPGSGLCGLLRDPPAVSGRFTAQPRVLPVLGVPGGWGSSVLSGLHLHIPGRQGAVRGAGGQANVLRAFPSGPRPLLAHSPRAR